MGARAANRHGLRSLLLLLLLLLDVVEAHAAAAQRVLLLQPKGGQLLLLLHLGEVDGLGGGEAAHGRRRATLQHVH